MFLAALVLLGPAPQQLVAQSAPSKQLTVLEQKQMRAEMLLKDSHNSINSLFRSRENYFKTLSDLHVSSASYPEIMRTLQTQRIQLTIDLAGIEAVEEALMKRTAVKQYRESDEVIQKLKENVALYQKYYDSIKALHERGTKSAQDMLSRELQLNAAKVKLAQAMAPREGTKVGELSSVAIERIEKQAKLSMIEKLLTKYYPGGPIVESLKESESRMELELSRKAQLERQLDEIKMEVFDFGVNEKD
jgi:hypothetical protein